MQLYYLYMCCEHRLFGEKRGNWVPVAAELGSNESVLQTYVLYKRCRVVFEFSGSRKQVSPTQIRWMCFAEGGDVIAPLYTGKRLGVGNSWGMYCDLWSSILLFILEVQCPGGSGESSQLDGLEHEELQDRLAGTKYQFRRESFLYCFKQTHGSDGSVGSKSPKETSTKVPANDRKGEKVDFDRFPSFHDSVWRGSTPLFSNEAFVILTVESKNWWVETQDLDVPLRSFVFCRIFWLRLQLWWMWKGRMLSVRSWLEYGWDKLLSRRNLHHAEANFEICKVGWLHYGWQATRRGGAFNQVYIYPNI